MLIELLMVIVFLGFALAIFVALFSTTISQNSQVSEQSVLQTEVRSAIDRLASDLRQAYTGDQTVPIQSIGPTSITFFAPDRAYPAFHLRKLSYQVVSNRLERSFATSTDTDGPPWSIGALGPWHRLFDSIKNSTVFRYYDASGVETLDAANVKTIVIEVVVEPRLSLGRQVTYKTSATIRASQE